MRWLFLATEMPGGVKDSAASRAQQRLDRDEKVPVYSWLSGGF